MQITLKGIGKTFSLQDGRRLEVLRDVSLALDGEEFCCLVGPSGCGKSTVLNIIAGLTVPDAGEVHIKGAAIDSSRARIGYVFQKPRLLNWRTVAENVALVLRAAGLGAGEARTRARHYLELVGLGQFRHEFPLALSGGMQQRVAIARALAIEPDLLLMDEPFSHLDELTGRTLRAELLRIWQRSRTPVIFVTHNALEAVYLADRVVVLSPRPTTILKELAVSIPRDRQMEDPQFVALQRIVLNSLGITDDAGSGAR